MKSFGKSEKAYEEARKYAPGGVHSNFRLGMRPFPLFFQRAEGSRLYDLDGNVFIDYAMGMGAVILGHANPEVNAAVAQSLNDGQLYAGQHRMETKLAGEICDRIPCAEMVRFGLSGSEVVQAALRVARAYTGKMKVVKFEGHYHGWLDNIFVSVHPKLESTEAPIYAPESGTLGQDPASYSEILVLPWNDLGAFSHLLLTHGHEIAAVLMEPVMCNTSVVLPRPGFLERVRELCTHHGVLLIFDEVITGFRLNPGGAQAYLKIEPDLAVFGKALGNGFPISCLAGRRSVMKLFAEGSVMHGGTYNTNTVSCAAALATVLTLGNGADDVYLRLAALTSRLADGVAAIASNCGHPLRVQAVPGVFNTTFSIREITDYRAYKRSQHQLQLRFLELLFERGIRVTGRGTWFLSAAHTENDVELTLEAVRDSLRVMNRELEASKVAGS